MATISRHENVVCQNDLYLMYNLFDYHYHVDVPYILAHFLSILGGGPKDNKVIVGAHFITYIARSYGIVTKEVCWRIEEIQPKIMDMNL